MTCREGLGHRTAPGKITRSRVAMISEGIAAEVVADSDEDSWARWFSGGAWAGWHHLAHRTEDISVTGPADGPDGPAALLSVTSWRPDTNDRLASNLYTPPETRSFYLLSATGLSPASL